MNFGLLLIIRNPQQWHRSDHDVYQGYIDNAVRAEDLGYSHIWTSEHHFSIDGWSPSQLPILAAIATRTRRIRLGTLVFLLPFHNPIRAAEDAATVDIISNGRLDLAVGTGGRIDEFATFGIPFKQRRPRMYEGLEIIQRCFSEEEFSFHGKYWHFDNVRMTTKPVQKPFPLWIGAMGEKALAEAGAHGYHLAAAPLAAQQQIYDKALREAGHDPSKFQRAGLKICHVAATTEKAWDEAEPHVHYHMVWHFGGLKQQLEAGLTSPNARSTDLSIPPLGELRKSGRGPYRKPFVGSPDDVIRMIADELKTNPATELVPTLGLPGMDPQVARRSMELFAKEVMPHFKDR